ncbi:DUF2145 domain-containing protein [Luteimonas sp. RIT-PG2_3]
MRVVDALDAHPASVAVVARVGTDLSKYGLVYSHAGFALRDHPDGEWTVLHLLNTCAGPTSALHAQGMVNFFADDLVNQDARIVWLQPELAQRLAERLRALPRDALHTPTYNLIARPGSRDYQNSTAWVLETLAAALPSSRPVHQRTQAYAVATQQGYLPDRIDIPYSQRLMGGLFGSNVAFTDHPVGTRLSGHYPVVTVRSILDWVDARGLSVEVREWRNGQRQAQPGPG